MPKYRATVQVSGLSGDNPRAVRSALDAQLRQIGLPNCRVVAVDLDLPVKPLAPRVPMHDGPDAGRDRPVSVGALLLVGAAAWTIWFFWLMLSNP